MVPTRSIGFIPAARREGWRSSSFDGWFRRLHTHASAIIVISTRVLPQWEERENRQRAICQNSFSLISCAFASHEYYGWSRLCLVCSTPCAVCQYCDGVVVDRQRENPDSPGNLAHVAHRQSNKLRGCFSIVCLGVCVHSRRR